MSQISAALGILDWPSPLWHTMDTALSNVLTPMIRLTLYAVFAGVVSMLIYRAVSQQAHLQKVKQLQAQTRQNMLDAEISFQALLGHAKQSLALAMQQMWMTFWPSIVASIPLMFVLPWLSNQFDRQWPQSGARIQVCAMPAASMQSISSTWFDRVALESVGGNGCRSMIWQDEAGSLQIDTLNSIDLPPPQAIPVLHTKRWWNHLIGNPNGYLPPHSQIQWLEMALPRQVFLPIGPAWMRGWLFWFLIWMIGISLWLRARWHLV